MRRFLTPVALVALVSSLKLVTTSTPLSEMNQTRHRRAAFPSCEAAAQSCVDHFPDQTSFPNIAAGKSIEHNDFKKLSFLHLIFLP